MFDINAVVGMVRLKSRGIRRFAKRDFSTGLYNTLLKKKWKKRKLFYSSEYKYTISTKISAKKDKDILASFAR